MPLIARTKLLAGCLLTLGACLLPATSYAASAAGGAAPEPPPKKAKIVNGKAVAPRGAPKRVKRVIKAANKIVEKPYRYGGGHQSFEDSGYDCSGSVSYALHGANLVDSPMPSSGYFGWGEPGEGQWVTIYTKASHMYLVVAGLRFDTSGRSGAGTRWQADMRDAAGFKVRHPKGL